MDIEKKTGFFTNPVKNGLVELRSIDLYKRPKRRLLRSSITLPSQYNAYNVCIEFVRDWFLDKFPEKYFNSVYVHGSKAFDQFRMFSKIDQQLKRTNPLLYIAPDIEIDYNRNFVDMNLEPNGLLRRARVDGQIFADRRPNKNLFLTLQMKTILMKFKFGMRVDTDAIQMQLIEFIKNKHRAGLTETQHIPLDIHVPKSIIRQMAFDNAIDIDGNEPASADEMLRYLNSYALVPFLYKRMNATGTYEYFCRIENCTVHIKSEIPTRDASGNADNLEKINFTPEFDIEVEMMAPYIFAYYSEKEQHIINKNQLSKEDTAIVLMKAVRSDLPETNEAGWPKLVTTEYIVDMEDLKNNITINFKDIIQGELLRIIDYTRSVALSPSLFMDFIIFNDGEYRDYILDWDSCSLALKDKVTHPGFIIGIYADMKYVNETKIHHNFSDGFNNKDSFRTSSRVGKIG